MSDHDYVVCGSGAAGAVVAGRLAADPDVSVLLLEAGGTDQRPEVRLASSYPTTRFPELFWEYRTAPQPQLGGRELVQLMGKVLGGGTGVNTMLWARGHRADFDDWAKATGDDAWGYEQVLRRYRRMEDWHGAPDPQRRGTGGPVFVAPATDPSPLAPAVVRAAAAAGIPAFDDHNGAMMEGRGGAAIANLIVRDGGRLSMADGYLGPRENLTVRTGATVRRVLVERGAAVGVEYEVAGDVHVARADRETVLSAGAFETPRLLQLSGIGDADELRPLGVPLVAHVPGVGANFQDHSLVASCVWEPPEPVPPRNNKAEATFFWPSHDALAVPDIQVVLIELPYLTEALAVHPVPPGAFALAPAIVRPRSRGRLRLRSADPRSPVDLEWNPLADPDDVRVLVRAVELGREVGNSAELAPFVRREVLPAPVFGADLDGFVRAGVTSYGHACGTARMGVDDLSVVDPQLRVHGIDRLRVADGSVMPTITTGNTMAPCAMVGERLAELLTGH